MKFTKIFSIVFLLICVSFLFAGCASINYTTMKYSNGEMVETVDCLLDEEKMETKGYDVEKQKLSIATTAYLALQDKYTKYLADVNIELNKALASKELERATLLEEMLESVIVYEPYWEENVLHCEIYFKSSSAYYLFYGLTEPNFKQEKIKENLFTNKIYYKGNLGYSLNHSLYSTIATRLDMQFMKFSEQDVNLTYSYLAPARRYHSNANYIQATKDGYLHTWIVGENIDQEIYFYLTLANRHAWYLLAIVISLFITFILLVIAVIKICIKPKKTLIKALIENTKTL